MQNVINKIILKAKKQKTTHRQQLIVLGVI